MTKIDYDLAPPDWRHMDPWWCDIEERAEELGLEPGELAGRALAAGAPGPRRRREPNLLARAVTKAQACRLLGVDKATLAALVHEGTVRTVRWRGQTGGKVQVQRERIPMSEIERLCEQGVPEPEERRAPRRKARRERSASEVAEAIVRIPI